jgi:hypothetical protein
MQLQQQLLPVPVTLTATGQAAGIMAVIVPDRVEEGAGMGVIQVTTHHVTVTRQSF